MEAEAGIIDQDFVPARHRDECAHEPVNSIVTGEIRRDYFGLYLESVAASRGDARQFRFISRHKNEIEPAGREFESERFSNSGRRAGDDGPFVHQLFGSSETSRP